MKNVIFLFCLTYFMGCYSVKVTEKDIDPSLFFQEDGEGRILLSTFNSSQKISITDYYVRHDTLVINYERCLICNPNNILPLNPNIKYLKCANRVFKVSENKGIYQIIE